MQEVIPIGKFKTHCYQLLDKSYKEHKHFTITRKGKPIVQIVPLEQNAIKKPSIFNMKKDTASIDGDIMAPLAISWEAER